jgi:hypothetical protein
VVVGRGAGWLLERRDVPLSPSGPGPVHTMPCSSSGDKMAVRDVFELEARRHLTRVRLPGSGGFPPNGSSGGGAMLKVPLEPGDLIAPFRWKPERGGRDLVIARPALVVLPPMRRCGRATKLAACAIESVSVRECPIRAQTSDNGSARISGAEEGNGSTKPLCTTPRHITPLP